MSVSAEGLENDLDLLVLAPLALEARAVRSGAPWARVERVFTVWAQRWSPSDASSGLAAISLRATPAHSLAASRRRPRRSEAAPK